MLLVLDEILVAIQTGGTGVSATPDQTWRDGQCIDCVHWDEILPMQVGTCRRFPPVIENEQADGTQVVVWSQTQFDDSCSEFVRFP